MGCMQPISEFSETCYHCGYPVSGQNPQGYLRVRTRLSDRYIAGRVLERRVDAAVYIGYDVSSRCAVLIREALPEGLVEREGDTVRPLSGREVVFDDCLERFRRQARAIGRMRDLPAVLPMYDLFEENGTVYTVSDRVEGMPFRKYLETVGGRLSWEDARPLMVPLISSLSSLHAAGLVHLNISPDTLLVDGENRLRLDGWQIPYAHTAGSPLPAQFSPGYSAPEQYRDDLPESAAPGQEADVYGLAATMLFALTGEEPPAAPERMTGEASLMVPESVAKGWPPHIAGVLAQALSLDRSKRIRTMEQLRERLTVEPEVAALRVQNEEEAPPPRKKPSRGPIIGMVVAIVAAALLAAAAGWMLINGSPLQRAPEENPAETTTTESVTTTTAAPTEPTGEQFAVVNVVGQEYAALRDQTFHGDLTVKMVGKAYSDSVPKGTILWQDPMPETYADRGSAISVLVSAGPESQPLPDIRGWEEAAARTYLEALGYRVSEVEVTVSAYEKGRVDSLSPAPGTAVREGDTVVLQISTVEPPTVPPTTAQTGAEPTGGNDPGDWWR